MENFDELRLKMRKDLEERIRKKKGERKKKEKRKCEKYGFEYDDGVDYVVQLKKYHEVRKEALGHRVQILRVLVRQALDDEKLTMTEFDFIKIVESTLDQLLHRFHYDLERLINEFRRTVKLPDWAMVCKECLYRPVFCRCSQQKEIANGNRKH